MRKDKKEEPREKNQKTGKDRAISQNLAKTGVGPAAMYSILTGAGAATTTVVGAGAEIGAGKSDASNPHFTPFLGSFDDDLDWKLADLKHREQKGMETIRAIGEFLE